MDNPSLKIHIEKAAQGSEESLNFLVNKYKPLLDSEVSRYTGEGMNSQDIDDLRQEAEIAFCNAVCNYDDSVGGVEFGLFAKICIDNSLISYIRTYNRRSRGYILSGEEHTPTEHADPIEKVIQDEAFMLLRNKISANLSPFENKVWWMYVSGMSAKKIAEALSVDGGVKSVNNAIYRIRRKLRAVIQNKG